MENNNQLLCEYLFGNQIEAEYYPDFINNWDMMMQVYSKIPYIHSQSKDEDLDILMDMVKDNLVDSDREGFFLSLVEVVNHLNKSTK